MKKITKKEKIEMIKKATKEIQDCLDLFNENTLKRVPTMSEILRWEIEITRGLLAHSKKVSDATCDLVDNYFVMTRIIMAPVVSEK
jgi:uncharacterized protein (UPF0128 family)